MNIQSIRWRLPLSYAGIALLAALSLGSVMLLVLNRYYTGLERDYLNGNAQTLKLVVENILSSNSPKQILQDQVSSLAFLSQTQIRVLDKNGQPIADSGIPGNYQVVSVASAPTSGGTVLFGLPANESFSVPANGSTRPPSIAVYYQGRAETAPSGQAVPLEVVTPAQRSDTPSAQTLPLEAVAPAQQSDTVISVNAAPMGGYGFTAAGGVAGIDVVSEGDRRSAQKVSLALENSLGSLEISNGPAYGSDILRSVAIAWALAGIFAIALAALTGWYISKQVTEPVLALTAATRNIEQGKLLVQVELPGAQLQEFTALAASFNDMAGQVANTISTLRAFVTDAAHELNTPLTALKTNLELASNATDALQKEAFLARAIEQNQRLERLTGSLLDLSRIETAQTAPDFEPLDLRQLSLEISERFASRAEQAERSFNTSIPGGEMMLRGNAQQLQRAIDNLLENALKFTPPGGSISLVLERGEEDVTISISDTGIGIPAEDLPHMFERFHRGRNSAQYPGNGLGLAIVKAVVTGHKGHVQVESAETGSKFSIRLPVA